jgi:DNA-binding response OmpR family regulator
VSKEEDILRRENRSLRDKLNLLEEQNLQLREQITKLSLPTEWEVPTTLNLTPCEQTILKLLYESPGVGSREKFINLLYLNKPSADPHSGNLIDVFISKIRKKSKPFGVDIDCVRARGYVLSNDSRTILANWDK